MVLFVVVVVAQYCLFETKGEGVLIRGNGLPVQASIMVLITGEDLGFEELQLVQFGKSSLRSGIPNYN